MLGMNESLSRNPQLQTEKDIDALVPSENERTDELFQEFDRLRELLDIFTEDERETEQALQRAQERLTRESKKPPGVFAFAEQDDTDQTYEGNAAQTIAATIDSLENQLKIIRFQKQQTEGAIAKNTEALQDAQEEVRQEKQRLKDLLSLATLLEEKQNAFDQVLAQRDDEKRRVEGKREWERNHSGTFLADPADIDRFKNRAGEIDKQYDAQVREVDERYRTQLVGLSQEIQTLRNRLRENDSRGVLTRFYTENAEKYQVAEPVPEPVLPFENTGAPDVLPFDTPVTPPVQTRVETPVLPVETDEPLEVVEGELVPEDETPAVNPEDDSVEETGQRPVEPSTEQDDDWLSKLQTLVDGDGTAQPDEATQPHQPIDLNQEPPVDQEATRLNTPTVVDQTSVPETEASSFDFDFPEDNTDPLDKTQPMRPVTPMSPYYKGFPLPPEGTSFPESSREPRLERLLSEPSDNEEVNRLRGELEELKNNLGLDQFGYRLRNENAIQRQKDEYHRRRTEILNRLDKLLNPTQEGRFAPLRRGLGELRSGVRSAGESLGGFVGERVDAVGERFDAGKIRAAKLRERLRYLRERASVTDPQEQGFNSRNAVANIDRLSHVSELFGLSTRLFGGKERRAKRLLQHREDILRAHMNALLALQEPNEAFAAFDRAKLPILNGNGEVTILEITPDLAEPENVDAEGHTRYGDTVETIVDSIRELRMLDNEFSDETVQQQTEDLVQAYNGDLRVGDRFTSRDNQRLYEVAVDVGNGQYWAQVVENTDNTTPDRIRLVDGNEMVEQINEEQRRRVQPWEDAGLSAPEAKPPREYNLVEGSVFRDEKNGHTVTIRSIAENGILTVQTETGDTFEIGNPQFRFMLEMAGYEEVAPEESSQDTQPIARVEEPVEPVVEAPPPENQ